MLHKSLSHLQILGTRRVTWSKRRAKNHRHYAARCDLIRAPLMQNSFKIVYLKGFKMPFSIYFCFYLFLFSKLWTSSWLNHWLIYDWIRDLMVPMHLGLNWRALFAPISIHGSPVTLLKFQMASSLMLLTSSGSKKEPWTSSTAQRLLCLYFISCDAAVLNTLCWWKGLKS